MKIGLKLTVTVAFLGFNLAALSQGVAINEIGASPDASAILDVSSDSKGFLAPRMTTAERDAIASPAIGLIIYNTTEDCLEWWNGTIWYRECGV